MCSVCGAKPLSKPIETHYWTDVSYPLLSSPRSLFKVRTEIINLMKHQLISSKTPSLKIISTLIDLLPSNNTLQRLMPCIVAMMCFYLMSLNCICLKKKKKKKHLCLSTVLPTSLYNVESYWEFQLAVHKDLLQLGHLILYEFIGKWCDNTTALSLQSNM